MDYWFTSDTHFGHDNVIQYCQRPYKDSVEMDEALIKNWNERVKPGDLVFHMGDFSFHQAPRTGEILHALNGKIVLVQGNHDKAKVIAQVGTRFEKIVQIHEEKVSKQRIVMCHFPMASWNKMHHGSWHLHGHCHGTLAPTLTSRRLDVGIDTNAMKPYSFEEVATFMSKIKFEPVDHHGRREFETPNS